MIVRFRRNLFDRWIILHTDDDFAWTGSRWAPISKDGMPKGLAQISNFSTEKEAQTYARKFGFQILEDEKETKGGERKVCGQRSKENHNPLKPSMTLLCKLGSIAVHAEEFLSPNADDLDLAAIRALLTDAEIKQWIKDMGPFMPVKR